MKIHVLVLVAAMAPGCGGSMLGANPVPGTAGRDQIGVPNVIVTVTTDVEVKVDEDRTLTGD